MLVRVRMTHTRILVGGSDGMTGPLSVSRKLPNAILSLLWTMRRKCMRESHVTGSSPVCVIANLDRRVAEDLIAVGIEAHAPEANGTHEFLGLVKLPVPSEDGVDKLAATVLAHGHWLLAAIVVLGGLPHVLLADLEKFLEAYPQPLARLQEVLDKLPVLLLSDLLNDLVGALDLAGQLDEEQPEVASHVRQWGGWAVRVDCPVVNPLAK